MVYEYITVEYIKQKEVVKESKIKKNYARDVYDMH